MKHYLIIILSLLTLPSINAADIISLYWRNPKGIVCYAGTNTPANLADVYQNTPHIFGRCDVFAPDGKYKIGDQKVSEREYTIALNAQNLQIYALILGLNHPDRVGSTNSPEAWTEYRKHLEFLKKARIEEDKRIKRLIRPSRCEIL